MTTKIEIGISQSLIRKIKALGVLSGDTNPNLIQDIIQNHIESAVTSAIMQLLDVKTGSALLFNAQPAPESKPVLMTPPQSFAIAEGLEDDDLEDRFASTDENAFVTRNGASISDDGLEDELEDDKVAFNTDPYFEDLTSDFKAEDMFASALGFEGQVSQPSERPQRTQSAPKRQIRARVTAAT